ncbi:hypothetical protein TNIN_74311 [Trichonephila inaurata madagascariensis]|uniref:Uncharacterized protein n=1 Tax=Trichonephila inaurata madagascariensis TaxID=2747483 RepID=A0A8X7C406_9ARAC|nr:hypothetical protein TNIN_74311 [Trichonephila inaurata madagascariensis]
MMTPRKRDEERALKKDLDRDLDRDWSQRRDLVERRPAEIEYGVRRRLLGRKMRPWTPVALENWKQRLREMGKCPSDKRLK